MIFFFFLSFSLLSSLLQVSMLLCFESYRFPLGQASHPQSQLRMLSLYIVFISCCFFILSYLFVFFYELSTTSRALKRLVLRCNIHKNIASAYLSSICASFINGTSTQHNLGPIADIWFHFSVVFQIRRRKNTESQTLEQKFLE